MDTVNCQDGMRMCRKLVKNEEKIMSCGSPPLVMDFVHSSESEITNYQS